MEKARRRRHVPAFGEWNYYSSSSSPDEPEPPRTGHGAAVDWWYVPDPEACSDVWFRYSPPARKPATKKARRPAANGGAVPAAEKMYGDGGKKGSAPAAARARASAERCAVAKGGARRTVRPVDEDLYQVPPPDFTPCRPRRSFSFSITRFE
ncbi:hypothetical protein EJB05_01978 [Eragrostis curvula]|uniref:Uncharacterized protein n=1 Tax=Eragrostis curvula TaxID=38414 RepID=A0A5J9WR55_9POAL|nr:hypothetical protein EJB05_01978 [Eragrostis curvula]